MNNNSLLTSISRESDLRLYHQLVCRQLESDRDNLRENSHVILVETVNGVTQGTLEPTFGVGLKDEGEGGFGAWRNNLGERAGLAQLPTIHLTTERMSLVIDTGYTMYSKLYSQLIIITIHMEENYNYSIVEQCIPNMLYYS